MFFYTPPKTTQPSSGMYAALGLTAHSSIRPLSPGLRVPVLSPVPSYPLSPVSASLPFKSGEFLSIQSYSSVISSVRPPSALASSWPLHLLLATDCLHLDISVDCEFL